MTGTIPTLNLPSPAGAIQHHGRPIRVLHFIGQLGVGGCEKQLLEFFRRADPAHVTFGLCYYSSTPDSQVREFEAAGAKLYYVDKRGGISLWRFFQTLRGFVRDFEPDIIHTWLYSANVWGRLVGLSCGHRRWISSDRSLTPYTLPLRILDRWCLAPWTVRTGNTEAVADWLSASIGLRRDTIRVIHNAVELPDLDTAICRADVRAELGLALDTPIVLTVGRQTEAKNYPMFYRTAKRVTQLRPDVVFLSAGHGEEEARLRELHQELGLGQSVRMLGLRKDVPRLMASADIFCLCSRYEGFPNVLVEAMASGLPAVSAAFPGVREVIEDAGRPCGLVVDLDRDDQMAEVMLELLKTDERRLALGQAARESALRRFSWPRLLDRMERLYEEVASIPGHQRATAPSGA